MKVFISWSGEKSKAVAAALHEWIPGILNNAKPWMSDLDIESGQDWNLRITGELVSAKFGIICVTPENQERPWLNFEAGAISKQVNGDDARVAPLLIGFETPTDLTGPMTKFHSRLSNAEGIRRLVFDINAQLEDPLSDGTLTRTFNALWPQLQEELSAIEKSHPGLRAARRDEREVVEEILTLVRGIHSSIGAPATRRLPSILAKDVSGAAREALNAAGYTGQSVTSLSDSRLKVTTDTPLPDESKADIEQRLMRLYPSLTVHLDVDPDYIAEMNAYAETYHQSLERGISD